MLSSQTAASGIPSFSFFGSTISAPEMALAPRYSYQRLKHEGLFDDYEENQASIARPRNWIKFRRMRVRRRSFRLRVPSLRKFLRRKFRLVRVSCTKVLKRLKEGKADFGDIFSGNYLFMQINPTPLKCLEESYNGTGLKFNGFAPRGTNVVTVSRELDLESKVTLRHAPGGCRRAPFAQVVKPTYHMDGDTSQIVGGIPGNTS